jgi:Na+-transporting methylmalonyl-CoA/oxaloacetate decarboxylase gamma subunit
MLASTVDLVNLDVGPAAVLALLGYAVVFFGISLLMVVVMIQGKIFAAKDAKSKKLPVKTETPVEAPVAEAPVADIPADVDAPTAATVAAPEPSTTVTQKKTLKLRRPNFKRPTVGGLRKPGATAAATAASEVSETSAPVADMDAVTDIPTIADIPEIKPMPTPAVSSSEDDTKTVSGVPVWLNAMTLVAGIAALIVVGLCTWSLFTQAVGPEAGPNGLASFYSETDRSR